MSGLYSVNEVFCDLSVYLESATVVRAENHSEDFLRGFQGDIWSTPTLKNVVQKR